MTSRIFLGGACTLETLVQLISQTVTQPEPDGPQQLCQMFRMYDRDGRGYISVTEMRHVLTNVGEKLSEQEADDLLKLTGVVDKNMVNYNSKFIAHTISGHLMGHFE